MHRSPIVQAFALSIVLLVLMGGVVQSQAELEPVVTDRGEQYTPFANDTYIIYSELSPARPNKSTAFARPLAGGTPIKLNEARTNGEAGGFDPGTNRVIYVQWTRQEEIGRLYFYDLDTGERTEVPGVNPRRPTWVPLISSTFIAFLRDHKRNGVWYTSLVVSERASGARRTVRTWREGVPLALPGSVGDRYVTYTHCTKKNCFAYLYDWETDTQRRIPAVDGKPQGSAVVDEVNSTVYFARAALPACGRSVGIWRLPIDLSGEATKVVDLPRGIDTGWIYSLTANRITGAMDLYFERWDCAEETGDIYVARGVDAQPSPASVPKEPGADKSSANRLARAFG